MARRQVQHNCKHTLTNCTAVPMAHGRSSDGVETLQTVALLGPGPSTSRKRRWSVKASAQRCVSLLFCCCCCCSARGPRDSTLLTKCPATQVVRRKFSAAANGPTASALLLFPAAPPMHTAAPQSTAQSMAYPQKQQQQQMQGFEVHGSQQQQMQMQQPQHQDMQQQFYQDAAHQQALVRGPHHMDCPTARWP